MSKLTPADITAKLNQPGPAASTMNTRQLPPPDREMAVSLTLEQLRPYERNPRTHRNPKYDEIKDSIRAVGLKQKISVTQRPNDDRYIISDGGNTRYSILSELWAETGDERFHRIDCYYTPWQGEINVLAGHLAENSSRGNLTWIENARGVYEAKKMLEEEEGQEISQRSLATHLRKLGYTVDQSRISRMLYTVEHLLPTLRQPLESGMGRPQVEKLVAFRNFCNDLWTRCLNYWQQHENDPGEGMKWRDRLLSGDFATAWHEEMSVFDQDGITDLDWGQVESALKGFLNDWTGIHFNILDLVWMDWFDTRGLAQRSPEAVEETWSSVDNELEHLRDPHSFRPSPYESPDNKPRKPRESRQPASEKSSELPEENSQDEGASNELDELRARLAEEETLRKEAERQLADQVSSEPAADNDGWDDSFLSGFGDESEDDDVDDSDLSQEAKSERLSDLTESPYEEPVGKRNLRQFIAAQEGEEATDFEADALRAIPLMSAGPVSPITDVWGVPRAARQVMPLRIQIGECVKALAEWAGLEASGVSESIVLNRQEGLGYELNPLPDASTRRAQLVWQLLAGFQGTADPSLPSEISILGELMGTYGENPDIRLPDGVLIRVWRMARLIRVLRETIDEINGNKTAETARTANGGNNL